MQSLNVSRLLKNVDRLALIIPHTHWDRAWYHPFEQFRLSLVKVFRRLLDILETDSRFRCFTFDGQTVVLEDYLEIHPEDRGRIEKLVRQGRLNIGPSYVLPDVFLPTGEALIRNGVIGQEIAESFGRSSRQGWVADPFGLISQLPQIFAGLGIESIFFSRGVSRQQLQENGPYAWWAGPDGASRILAIAQLGGYSNLMNWGVPPKTYPREDPDTANVDYPAALARLKELLKTLGEFPTPSKLLFLGNGNDHHPAQHKLPDLVAYCAPHMPKLGMHIVSSDEFIGLLKQESPKLGTIRGELFANGLWPTLEGTFDSRFYLKQQLDRGCMLLEKWAEPMLALAEAAGAKRRVLRLEHHVGFAFNVGNNSAYVHDVRADVKNAWKTLLRNTPHDDICGCSTDATHRDAENRSKRVEEVASLLASDAALHLAAEVRRPAFDAAAQVFLFNPLGRERTVDLSRTFTLASHDTKLRLVDESGLSVPANIRTRVAAGHFRRWNSDDFEALNEKAIEVRIDAQVVLPASGYRCLYVQAGTPEAPAKTVTATAKTLENAHVRLSVNADGSFDLLDKQARVTYRRQNSLVDCGDAGDLYLSRLLGDHVGRPVRAKTKLVQTLPDKAAIEVKVLLRLPAGLTPDRTARSEKLLPLEVTFTYTLLGRSPAVLVRAEFTNAQADHRLTVEFPTGLATSQTHAGSTFDVVGHKAPFQQASCRDFVSAAAAGGRLTLLSRSMHSYDARLAGGKLVLAKCLLKANGFVHRSLVPHWAAPEGNCIDRPAVQEYAVLPGRQTDDWDSLQKAAEEFVAPPFIEWMAVSQGVLPGSVAFLRVPGPLHVSALKQADHGNSLILRLYNASRRPVHKKVWLSHLLKVRAAYECDLRERRQRPAKLQDQELSLALRPWQILTVELSRD